MKRLSHVVTSGLVWLHRLVSAFNKRPSLNGNIEGYLLDNDGSCRDINFDGLSWEGVEKLVHYLIDDYEDTNATAEDGKTIALQPHLIITSVLSDMPVNLLLAKNSGLIKELQIYILCEVDKTPFIELTFFPDALEPNKNLQQDFIDWLDDLQKLLQAKRYYVRYENASWKQGDISDKSGVFLVSDSATEVAGY